MNEMVATSNHVFQISSEFQEWNGYVLMSFIDLTLPTNQDLNEWNDSALATPIVLHKMNEWMLLGTILVLLFPHDAQQYPNDDDMPQIEQQE